MGRTRTLIYSLGIIQQTDQDVVLMQLKKGFFQYASECWSLPGINIYDQGLETDEAIDFFRGDLIRNASEKIPSIEGKVIDRINGLYGSATFEIDKNRSPLSHSDVGGMADLRNDTITHTAQLFIAYPLIMTDGDIKFSGDSLGHFSNIDPLCRIDNPPPHTTEYTVGILNQLIGRRK